MRISFAQRRTRTAQARLKATDDEPEQPELDTCWADSRPLATPGLTKNFTTLEVSDVGHPISLRARGRGVLSSFAVGNMHSNAIRVDSTVLLLTLLLASTSATNAHEHARVASERSESPIALSLPTQIVIPGDRIFPESITSTTEGRVIIGSVTTRQIFASKPGGATAEPWISADTEISLGVYGVLADEASKSLWACFAPSKALPAAQVPSALKKFDLDTGRLEYTYPLPSPGARCNDIAVGPAGTVYITDSANMEIDRLNTSKEALETWAGGAGFGPKDGVVDGIVAFDDRVLINTWKTGKIFSMAVRSDGRAGPIIEMKLERTLENPDGMRPCGYNCLLLAESSGRGRISMIELQEETARLRTVKEGYPGGPVAITLVGDTAYVLEGQFAGLFGGPGRENYKLTPFHATALKLSPR